MGAEGVGVEETLTAVGVLLRLSRVKPALGFNGAVSAKLTKGASPFSGLGLFFGAGVFPGAFEGVLGKYLSMKHIANTIISTTITTPTWVELGDESATFCACSAPGSPV